MFIHETLALVKPGRGAGWGITRDSARLHLAQRLRTALGGGLSPADSLRAIADELHGLRLFLIGVKIQLGPAIAAAEDGAPLSDALASARLVEDWERRLLETGERAGSLEQALEAWIEALRVRACGLRVVPQVLVYPISVALIAIMVVSLLAWKVLPTFATMMTVAGRPFAAPTQLAFQLAEVSLQLVVLLFALGGVLGLVLLVARLDRGPVGRLLDRFLFFLPLIGPARRAMLRAIGLEGAAAALDAGDSEVEAFGIAAQVQSSEAGRRAWARVAEEIAGGETVEGAGLLGSGFLRSVQGALASENRSARLRQLGRRELEAWWRRAESAVAWAEPILVLGLGAFLGAQVAGWWVMIHATGGVVLP